VPPGNEHFDHRSSRRRQESGNTAMRLGAAPASVHTPLDTPAAKIIIITIIINHRHHRRRHRRRRRVVTVVVFVI